MNIDSNPPDPKRKQYAISVHSLVEFVMQSGDLSVGGFQRRDRAQLGTQGHKRVQRSRPNGYEAEVEIHHQIEHTNPPLEVRGRIDGLYAQSQPVIIEEIKTTTLSLSLISEDHNALHWAQAKCYAYMYALQNTLNEIDIHLTYYQLDDHNEKTFERHYTLRELEIFFFSLVNSYLDWHQKVQTWQSIRDHSIEHLEFPYKEYRSGQRNMAVSVYKTIQNTGRVFIQSPTGVGKTIATLFPSIKALGLGITHKIFYLTAKTSGRLVAEKAMNDMRQKGLYLRSITLTAKEKICFCPPVNCDPTICQFARGYFDKVKNALQELDLQQDFTRPVIEDLARKYEICPFEFSLDLSLWVDCIICDYNYVFDPRVYLHRFFDFNTEPYTFLVDEAHNLPDRARSMYSAELDKETVLELQRMVKTQAPKLAKKLGEINKVLLEKRKTCQAEGKEAIIEYEAPAPLLKSLREFSHQAEDWLIQNQAAEFRQKLLEFYFLCGAYLRTAEYFDSFYVSYFERKGQADLKAKLFCLDPAPLLALPLERSRATIFFSATLLPMEYFKKILTGSADHPSYIFQSPFPQENACLLIHNTISTRYTQRTLSYDAIAEAIETTLTTHTGNYLVYFPSYAYLNEVAERLKLRTPERQILIQERGMTEESREIFLSHFSSASQSTLVGFAVMGGIFGEGIDLVGDRLIGVIVVGVGLPQLGLERDLIKGYFDHNTGSGFTYAYQYPGFNRVLQATGRVIRTETDQGVILLIDERFTQTAYRSLFPSHWRGYQVVKTADELKHVLTNFWKTKNKSN